MVALKRQLVQTEKARRQGELKAAAQVKEAEMQVSSVHACLRDAGQQSACLLERCR